MIPYRKHWFKQLSPCVCLCFFFFNPKKLYSSDGLTHTNANNVWYKIIARTNHSKPETAGVSDTIHRYNKTSLLCCRSLILFRVRKRWQSLLCGQKSKGINNDIRVMTQVWIFFNMKLSFFRPGVTKREMRWTRAITASWNLYKSSALYPGLC